MRHQLVGFFACRVEGNRLVDIVVHREGHVGVGAIDAAGTGIDQVLDAVVAATFEDVAKTDQVGLYIGVGILEGIAHTRLGGEVDDMVGLFAIKQGV